MEHIKIEKPWGYEIVWAKTEIYVGKILKINPGGRLSRQYHAEKEETIYVNNGVLHLETGPNYQGDLIRKVKLYPGESFHIKPGLVHRFCAGKDASVELVEVSTPQLDDVIRLEDDYSRS